MSDRKRIVLYVVLLSGLFCLSAAVFPVYAQARNSITGGVFGIDRRPLPDLNIELLDEFGSTVQRTRTNGAGRYSFFRLPAQRFTVRVLTYGTDYLEQEQSVEFVNFTQATPSGGTLTSGTSNEQRDFYLRLRKGVDPTAVGVVFAQDVPPAAKKLYDQAIGQLSDKKTKEAYDSLKEALEIFPNYFLALDRLGKEYVNAGYYEPAAILLDMAVKVNDRSYSSWHGLAHALYSLKRYDEALKAVNKALEINSSDPAAVLLSGVLLRHNKRYDEAEKQLLKARDLAKGQAPQVHLELGLLYANNLKRYAEAARELRAYLKNEKNVKDPEAIKKVITELDAKAQAGN